MPGFSGGFIGVDVFFVLSGYLITGLLVKEHESKGRIGLAGFYARRARRLLPAVAAFLLATILAAYFVYPPVKQRGLSVSALATAAYASNLYFARTGIDYQAGEADTNPFLHTWSLSVEEQFYFVWPLLVLFGLRGGRRRLLLVMVALAVVSFSLSMWLTFRLQPFAFFLSPARAWEFAIGGLGALISRRWFDARISWLGLAAILGAAVLFNEHTTFPGFAVLLPVLGAICVLRAEGARAGKYLGAAWLQPFGRLSYSWYLWHWPVLVMTQMLWGEVSLSVKLACLLFSLALAEISYRYVENPIRRNRKLALRPAPALVMAACLTVLSASVAAGWFYVAARASVTPAQIRYTHALTDQPFIEDNGCVVRFFGDDVQGCAYGRDNAPLVVLFGDSHASHWFPALYPLAEAGDIRLLALIKSACSPADVSYIQPALRRRYTECESWREKVFERIKVLQPFAVVVSSSQTYTFDRERGGIVAPADWRAGTKRMLSRLSESTERVIYLRDTPRPGFDVPACLAGKAWREGWRDETACTFARTIGLNSEVHGLEQETVKDIRNVEYVDLTGYLCPDDLCQTERNGVVIYRDAHHMAATFAATLTLALEELLK